MLGVEVLQAVAHLLFDFLHLQGAGVAGHYYVKGEYVVLAVHGPGVNVVHTFYTVYFEYRLADGGFAGVIGNALQYDAEGVLHILEYVVKDNAGYTEREYGVKYGYVYEHHDDAADEYGDPAEHIFEEMKGYYAFVYRCSFLQTQHGDTVNEYTEDGKDEHAFYVGLLGILETFYGFNEDEYGAYGEYDRVYECTEQGETFIAVGKCFIARLAGLTLEIPCRTERKAVAQVVQGVGHDGHGVGIEPADDFEYGEACVEPEGKGYVTGTVVMVVVPVTMVMMAVPVVVAMPVVMVVVVIVLMVVCICHSRVASKINNFS